LYDRTGNSAGISCPLSADSTEQNFTANASQHVNKFCDTLRSSKGIIRSVLIPHHVATLLLLRYSDWLRAGRLRGRSSIPGGGKNFHFPTSSRPTLGPTQPPIQWVPGTLSPGVKRQGREADRYPPTSAEVKKMWIYTYTPPDAFMAYCVIS
jgi:hypothetical protein